MGIDTMKDDVFIGKIVAKKVYHFAKAEKLDLKAVSQNEHKHYDLLRKKNSSSYWRNQVRIMAYLGELDRLIIHIG